MTDTIIDACIHGPGVAHCGHPDCVGDRDAAAGLLDIWGASQLHVLSVNRGHLRLTIDPDNPEDVERARRIITEMMERGYAIFVEDPDGSTHRVKKFNTDALAYVIDDTKAVKAAMKKAKAPTREVPIATAKATAVGRTAGG